MGAGLFGKKSKSGGSSGGGGGILPPDLKSAGTFEQKYELGDFIKKGVQGSAYHCKRTGASTYDYVCKKMVKSYVANGEILKEVRVLKRLAGKDGHLKYYNDMADAYEVAGEVWLVLEKAPGMDMISGSWSSAAKTAQIQHGLRFVHQTMWALHKLHEMDLVHRDPHIANLCVSDPDITHAGTHIIIIDFGRCIEVTAGTYANDAKHPVFYHDYWRLAGAIQALNGLKEFDNDSLQTLADMLKPRPVEHLQYTMLEIIQLCATRKTPKGKGLGLFPQEAPGRPYTDYDVTGFTAGYDGPSRRVGGGTREEDEDDDEYLEFLREQNHELLGEQQKLRATLARLEGFVVRAQDTARDGY